MRHFALALLVLLAGCKDSPSAPPVPDLDGRWRGNVTTSGQLVDLTVSESNGAITGSGTITTSSGPRALTVSGSFNRPTVNMTCAPGGTTQPLNIAATMNASGSELSGTVNGSGFVGDPIILIRQ